MVPFLSFWNAQLFSQHILSTRRCKSGASGQMVYQFLCNTDRRQRTIRPAPLYEFFQPRSATSPVDSGSRNSALFPLAPSGSLGLTDHSGIRGNMVNSYHRRIQLSNSNWAGGDFMSPLWPLLSQGASPSMEKNAMICGAAS